MSTSFGVPNVIPESSHQWRTIVCSSCQYTFKVPLYCLNRFCPVCTGSRRRRIRSKLTSLASQVKPSPGYSLKHLTLTIPNSADPFSTCRSLVCSFRRLRQRSFWGSKVRGGAYVIEVTGKPGSWHVHLHSIVESKYLPFPVLLKYWRRVSPGRGVYIKAAPPHAITHYLTKYLTKSDLPVEHQKILAKAMRGLRLFQCFGTWHDLIITQAKVDYCCPSCGDVCWFPLDDHYINHLKRLFPKDYDESYRKHYLPTVQ